MNDFELLQQALDALTYKKWFRVGLGEPKDPKLEAAITSLNERLAHCDRCGKKMGGEGDIHTCTPPAAPKAALDRIKEALPEFRQQDDYLLAHGASLLSEQSHEIIHVDTALRIAGATPPAAAQPDLADEVIGCFNAAEIEGLTAALANTTDEHLKDLVERRLMYALYAAQEAKEKSE
jgi:hypothetical protein